MKTSQTPMYTKGTSNKLDIAGSLNENLFSVGMTDHLSTFTNQYTSDPRGLFISRGISLDYDQTEPTQPDVSISAMAGIGYGRVVDARTISQVYTMYQILGKNQHQETY